MNQQCTVDYNCFAYRLSSKSNQIIVCRINYSQSVLGSILYCTVKLHKAMITFSQPLNRLACLRL